MPPKPLAEDLARKKAEKDKAAFQPPPGFPQLTNPAPVTATIGNVDPNTRPPNKGLKRFFTGPGGGWSDLAKGSYWVDGIKDAINENLVQPIAQLPSAFDPTANLSAAERINRAGSGALAAADILTPFVPEGTIVNSFRREAMERMLDDEVARFAASGGGVSTRGGLVLHGSPQSELPPRFKYDPRNPLARPPENPGDVIEPRFNSFALPSREVAYATDIGAALAMADNDIDAATKRFVDMVRENAQYARNKHRASLGTAAPPRGPSDPDGFFYAGRVQPQSRLGLDDLYEGELNIKPDRMDNYVISTDKIPVQGKTNLDWYHNRWYDEPRSNPRYGPLGIPRTRRTYPDGTVSSLDEQLQAAFGALERMKLKPAERRRLNAIMEYQLKKYARLPVTDF
jgi:hypothetical protein